MSDASINQIQQELEHRRENIDGTLTAIERRLSFEELANSPVQYFQQSVLGEYGYSLKNAVVQNPIPMTLLGIGLVWLMMGGQRASSRVGDTLQDSARSAGESLQSGAEAIKEKARAGAQNLQERVQDTTARLQGKVQDTAERLQGKAQGSAGQLRNGRNSIAQRGQETVQQVWRSTESYGRKLQEHPLALSFVGVALGAALAALIPETQAEHQTLGEARDRLAEQAKAKGEQLMTGAKSAAETGARAAKEEAQRQGMGSP